MNNTEIILVDTQDQRLLEMWVHGRPATTQRAYRHDAQELLQFTGKRLQEITLYDLQAFADSLQALAEGTQARTLKAVKSLFTFAHRIGYIPLNVAAALKLPRIQEKLAQRILTEEQVILLIASTEKPRDHAMLRLLYHCGLRVSEVVAIQWKDLVERRAGGQVSVFGKGGKTRHILINKDMWNELLKLRADDYSEDEYVFQSRKGHGKLDESQVNRIVRDAAKRTGIKGNVSPHWLRHAHASHSLDRGANINLVRDTLGHASLATTGKYTHARPNASSSQYLPL